MEILQASHWLCGGGLNVESEQQEGGAGEKEGPDSKSDIFWVLLVDLSFSVT